MNTRVSGSTIDPPSSILIVDAMLMILPDFARNIAGKNILQIVSAG
jgi:hypothetical protein